MTTTPYNKIDYYNKMNIKYCKDDYCLHLSGCNPLFLTPEKLSAASIIATHYNTSITFISPHPRIHTPDIVFFDTLWKIKSPIGRSFRSIERQIKRALPYSGSIIFDARKIAISVEEIQARLAQLATQRAGTIRHLILIRKDGTIIEIR